jgi:hypothetical protein
MTFPLLIIQAGWNWALDIIEGLTKTSLPVVVTGGLLFDLLAAVARSYWKADSLFMDTKSSPSWKSLASFCSLSFH